MFSTLLASLLALSSPHAAPKPSMELLVNPRMSVRPIPDQRSVLLTVVVHNADESLWCPAVLVEWGDGQISKREGETCTPLEQADRDDVARSTVFLERHSFWSGTFRIRVTLFHGMGKIVKRDHVDIEIE